MGVPVRLLGLEALSLREEAVLAAVKINERTGHGFNVQTGVRARIPLRDRFDLRLPQMNFNTNLQAARCVS